MRKAFLVFGALGVVLLAAAGYWWTHRVPASDLGGGKGMPGAIWAQIAQKKDQLKKVPGRTGILVEESRYSLFDEELIIRDFFQDRQGGFFVDVGCAWPIKANNTYYLEKHLGWHGIGIDALPDYGAEWKKERPASKFFNNLVTSHSGTKETFFKSEDPGLSSTNADWATGKVHGDKRHTDEIQVAAITLDDLLEREGVEKVDLLSMDIEGHELEALHGFDIDRYKPELVVTEGDDEAVAQYFAEHGYEAIERYRPFDDVNTYFRRKDTGRDGGAGAQ